MLIAGKAHPRDADGKRLLERLFELRDVIDPDGGRVAFLEDYDLALARQLVSGCDVWVNLPRPPLEASGTSGMKAMFNGCLHLSDPRRLVGGGLQRQERLGDRGQTPTPTSRSPTPPTPRRSTTCSRTR